MDMRCHNPRQHPSHRWIDTDGNGYLCPAQDAEDVNEPLTMEAPEPVPVEQHEAPALDPLWVRETKPNGAALEQLSAFLDGRSVGVYTYSMAGSPLLEWFAREHSVPLSEAEVRRLTSLFVLLGLEIAEQAGEPEPHQHSCADTTCTVPLNQHPCCDAQHPHYGQVAE